MDTQVIIAGAGPVGLLLAAELRLHGVAVVVVERLAEPSPYSKAFGLHARSVETMRLRGLVERLTERGSRHRRSGHGVAAGAGPIRLAHFAGIRTIRLDRLASGCPGMLPIEQAGTEEVLAARAVESGAVLRRGRTVVDLAQDAAGVAVRTDGSTGEEVLRAGYLVGCDGGRSTVRKLAGFGFPGSEPTVTGRLAEAAVPGLLEDPGIGWHRTAGGILQILPGRILTVEFDGPPADRGSVMSRREMAESMSRVAGRPVDFTEEPTWLSRFTDNTRLADTYRRGRVLLAGDAAHVHSPFGGQGLNLGLQDAANLGWKLAATVDGWAPDGLLDSYESERRPVAARVLHNTRAQVALMNPDPAVTPLREFFAELMELEPVNRHLGELITALDVAYRTDEQPPAGGFLPDLRLRTVSGDVRSGDLFHAGRPVLFDLADDPALRAAARPWTDRIDVLTATAPDDPGHPALLVRPDGYTAWAGRDPDGLRAALRTWFGAPADDLAPDDGSRSVGTPGRSMAAVTRTRNLALVSGSTRAGSTNTAVVLTLAGLLGDAVRPLPYLAMARLPHFNPDDDTEPLPEEVGRLRRLIAESDAIMFCTPEYAGDLPGSFKNLLDWTVGGVEIVGKPVGWINASSSPTGAEGAHRALRTVLGYTGAAVVDAACVRAPVARGAVDAESGMITDPQVRDAITEAARALLAAAAGESGPAAG